MKLSVSELRRAIRNETKSILREASRPRRLSSLLFEDADPKKIDPKRFPAALSAAAAIPAMKQRVIDGLNDNDTTDDVVGVRDKSWAVSALKPSQSTMRLDNAVGMAIAEAYLASHLNRPWFAIIDLYSYSFVSDGDLMEGVVSEAASLAGHLKL